MKLFDQIVWGRGRGSEGEARSAPDFIGCAFLFMVLWWMVTMFLTTNLPEFGVSAEHTRQIAPLALPGVIAAIMVARMVDGVISSAVDLTFRAQQAMERLVRRGRQG